MHVIILILYSKPIPYIKWSVAYFKMIAFFSSQVKMFFATHKWSGVNAVETSNGITKYQDVRRRIRRVPLGYEKKTALTTHGELSKESTNLL